jgi:hypothetical protein
MAMRAAFTTGWPKMENRGASNTLTCHSMYLCTSKASTFVLVKPETSRPTTPPLSGPNDTPIFTSVGVPSGCVAPSVSVFVLLYKKSKYFCASSHTCLTFATALTIAMDARTHSYVASASGSSMPHTAYVTIRHHTSAYVSRRQHK